MLKKCLTVHYVKEVTTDLLFHIVTEIQDFQKRKIVGWGLSFIRIRIRIRKSFIAKCVCTHKEFVLVLGASSTESTNIVQTT